MPIVSGGQQNFATFGLEILLWVYTYVIPIDEVLDINMYTFQNGGMIQSKDAPPLHQNENEQCACVRISSILTVKMKHRA